MINHFTVYLLYSKFWGIGSFLNISGSFLRVTLIESRVRSLQSDLLVENILLLEVNQKDDGKNK